MLPIAVDSPLTGELAKLVRSVPTGPLIDAYAAQFGYDAAPCFTGMDEIGLYECPTTGMRFYYPESTAGPESLYRTLEQFEWNYQDKKWEHDVALTYLSPEMRVLDVGCGEGNFLARAAASGAIATGIELNRSAGAKAAAKGIEIREELVVDHASVRPEYYDLVTSFQVLEHVVDPRSFIVASLQALKPGGTLIIGVPNDDGFVGMDDQAVLNQPPHHMTLWGRRSLEALAPLFDLRVRAFETEPLNELEWYQSLMERKYLIGPWRRRLYYRFGWDRLFRAYLKDNAATIAGHSIFAAYEKPA